MCLRYIFFTLFLHLQSEKYRKYFKMHIEKERSVENIMFYEDVEKYKALKLKLRQKKAKEIIEKYLLPDSLQGININRVLANNILRRIGMTIFCANTNTKKRI